MTLRKLGALRFSGLFADFGSLPIDATLIGAIFDAVDTVQKWVFDGSAWVEFPKGTGEINDGANVGAGTGLVFRDKIGVTLNFKSLIGGTNITVTDNSDDITISSTGTSPLTTKGDLFGFSTLDDRIPVGTDNQVLSAQAGEALGVKWIDLLFTKGQILSFDGTTLTQLAIGTADQILSVDAAEATGMKWIDPAAGGGAGITGLNPNSTILEYLNTVSTVFDDYTTPSSASATSESGGGALDAIDQDIGTFWQSDAGINESITLDMGSVVNAYGLAYYLDKVGSGITETQFQIQSLLPPIVATGGTETTTDGFKVHTFTTSGTFEITSGMADVEVLVIAGGGGGGGSNGGGGGAGGNVTDTTSRTVGTFTVTVGTGGAGGSLSSNGVNGVDSAFDTTIATGGGGGGSESGSSPLSVGGSGGGATGASGPKTGGLGTVGQGFDGGDASTGGSLPGGGGGGASEVGADGVNTLSGNGGDGLQNNIDGLNLFRAGGGGGGGNSGTPGTGGSGGGGAGVVSGTGSAGTVNTGGGGGGAGNGGTGGLGGSGIVIVRYPLAGGVDRILRTINVSDLAADAWNFIRFNGENTQLLRIEGSSGNALIMAANELAVQIEADPPLTTKHGQFTIDGTNANLPLNGGDPTSSVIDDPSTTSMTLVNGATQSDPVTGAMVMWQETLDANNDVSRSKMKIDGQFREVRWF